MRYLISFSYDGTNFNGYQKQDGLRTIQEEMEKAVELKVPLVAEASIGETWYDAKS